MKAFLLLLFARVLLLSCEPARQFEELKRKKEDAAWKKVVAQYAHKAESRRKLKDQMPPHAVISDSHTPDANTQYVSLLYSNRNDRSLTDFVKQADAAYCLVKDCRVKVWGNERAYVLTRRGIGVPGQSKSRPDYKENFVFVADNYRAVYHKKDGTFQAYPNRFYPEYYRYSPALHAPRKDVSN